MPHGAHTTPLFVSVCVCMRLLVVRMLGGLVGGWVVSCSLVSLFRSPFRRRRLPWTVKRDFSDHFAHLELLHHVYKGMCVVAKSIYLLWPVFLFSVVVFYANSWECDGFAELDVLTNTIRRGKTFSKSSPSWRTNKCCAQPTSLWKKREPANTQLVFCVASK